MIPSGSKTALTARCRAISGSPSSRGSHFALSEPTPCSPVIGAAHAERLAHQPVERRLRASPAVRVVQREEEARVQVAVASVPRQRDVDAVLRAEPVSRPDEVGQPADRDAHVLGEVGALELQGRVQRPAPGHERLRLLRVVGHRDLQGTGVGEHRRIPLHVLGRTARPVGLDEDRSGAPGGEPVVREPLHRLDGRPVEHLDEGRSRAFRPERHDTGGRRLERPERGERRQRRVRRRHQPQDDRGHHAQQPLGAHEQPGEVEPGHALGRPAAGAHHRSARQDDLEPAHVVGGHAVLHAAEAAGVGRDVAAERAAGRRRGVRWVGQPRRRRGRLERPVDHPGADHGDALELVELLDLVQPLDVEHDRALRGDRSAGQPGPGALRDHRAARRGGLGQHVDHVGPVAGPHHLERAGRHRAERGVHRVPRGHVRVGEGTHAAQTMSRLCR